jgi:SNF2 family DNA or RNA helicase
VCGGILADEMGMGKTLQVRIHAAGHCHCGGPAGIYPAEYPNWRLCTDESGLPCCSGSCVWGVSKSMSPG